MPKVEELANSVSVTTEKLPVSVIVAARNEEKNLPRCLASMSECVFVEQVYPRLPVFLQNAACWYQKGIPRAVGAGI